MDVPNNNFYVVYSEHHSSHNPEVEFVSGRLDPYRDHPGRIHEIRDQFAGSSIATLVEVSNPITEEEITLVHDPELVKYVKTCSEKSGSQGEYNYPTVFACRPAMGGMATHAEGMPGFYSFDAFSPIGKGSWQAVLYSATVAAEGAALSLRHRKSLVYALCRPPGHHAGTNFCGGYCYFNNSALAAKSLLKAGRVAILDIDYHHGNGTQQIFWEEPKVFYGSIHGDPVFEYPYYSGYADEKGGKTALGTNFNIPLAANTQSNTYLAALETLCDAIVQFDPASLVISVGFDTFSADPLGSFKLEVDDFAEIGAHIAQLRLPTLFVQEGGYASGVQGALAISLAMGFLR